MNNSQTTPENQQTIVRAANSSEAALVLLFIQKKSEFDRTIGAFSGSLKTSEAKIAKTMFGAVPFAYALFAEVLDHPVGFALYYFRYSSFAGQPSLWLDDLYVHEAMRSKRVGAALMNHLAQIAHETLCSHIAWTVDARNTRGLSFYQRLGAEITEQKGTVCFFTWKPQAQPTTSY